MKKFYILLYIFIIGTIEVYTKGYRCYRRIGPKEINTDVKNNQKTNSTNTPNLANEPNMVNNGNIDNILGSKNGTITTENKQIPVNVPVIKAPPYINNINRVNNNENTVNNGNNVKTNVVQTKTNNITPTQNTSNANTPVIPKATSGSGLQCVRHVVTTGNENCSSIANDNGIGSYFELRKINLTLNCDSLGSNTKVCIKAEKKNYEYSVYTVENGDSCSTLSKITGASESYLIFLTSNGRNYSSCKEIRPGDSIEFRSDKKYATNFSNSKAI
ncbi:hypothetical protein H8356DRAFT_1050093 [Neocallimastix lanati (nom. inval.)]|jgi:hypothetical protein|uniref:LysM domain-containing protein n=1 Tax=Neocallimastix californiae TaxID=1754190 RepID=A0A1Y2AH60_9FUNG|nr:hypothetical protein H8356DRAFT_1050093 [Neocallimastix sp. JGI-2020a]ORY21812.1 hypothetical protein LY90DRAFT_676094 [Neocallimastix californiae]|eukprot:ORY21812.1 hypothetical protein LY90DRAFT_676094 [Neocallimastix californiae]